MNQSTLFVSVDVAVWSMSAENRPYIIPLEADGKTNKTDVDAALEAAKWCRVSSFRDPQWAPQMQKVLRVAGRLEEAGECMRLRCEHNSDHSKLMLSRKKACKAMKRNLLQFSVTHAKELKTASHHSEGYLLATVRFYALAVCASWEAMTPDERAKYGKTDFAQTMVFMLNMLALLVQNNELTHATPDALCAFVSFVAKHILL